MKSRIIFFVGKGGVGKSTVSALTSLNFAKNNLDTLLVSMDPAHNQRDIFDRHFSEKPEAVSERLSVKEIDIDYWVKKYLKESRNHLKQCYAYQSAYNLTGFFDVLQFSPGLEEHAMVRAFEGALENAGKRDVAVFDMPPTALTLRFFSLPFITLIWLEQLMKLRERITDKKEIVSKIKWGKKQIEQDKVKSKLTELIACHVRLRNLFLSERITVNLVLNEDKLSFSEARRIQQKLLDMGISVHGVVVNKMAGHARIPSSIEEAFPGKKITGLPMGREGLSGMDALNQYTDLFRDKLLEI